MTNTYVWFTILFDKFFKTDIKVFKTIHGGYIWNEIVADSSANLLSLPDIDFGVVPLHIIVGENDYIDDDKIDLTAMQENLSSYKGKTSTSSPSPHEWENAFGDADVVFCITITSSLSGTYNSAVIAKDIYEHNHTGRKVYVLDSLSTGPEIALFIEK